MNRDQDMKFMRAALRQAARGGATPGGAQVGCVVEDNEQVSASFNEGDLRSDPTVHAEMVAIAGFARRGRRQH